MLEGHLDLRDFVNLRELYLARRKITGVDLSNCVNLEKIQLAGNPIASDLNIFSHLTKLKRLELGLDNWWLKKEIEKNKNTFRGSLEALKNCQDLEFLCIANLPKIKCGLEYLPTKKLRLFSCRGTEFEKQLKPWRDSAPSTFSLVFRHAGDQDRRIKDFRGLYAIKSWQLAQKAAKFPELEKQPTAGGQKIKIEPENNKNS